MLDIKFCPIQNSVITGTMSKCPKLITCNILGSNKLGDITLTHPSVQRLTLSNCHNIGKLVLSMTSLRQIELTSCSNLSQVVVADDCPKLFCFGITFCNKLDVKKLTKGLQQRNPNVHITNSSAKNSLNIFAFGSSLLSSVSQSSNSNSEKDAEQFCTLS